MNRRRFVIVVSILAVIALSISFSAAMRREGRLALKKIWADAPSDSGKKTRRAGAEELPPFALKSAVLTNVDLVKRDAQVLLVFSRPPSLDSVKGSLAVEVNGSKISNVSVSETDLENELGVGVKLPLLSSKKELKIKVAKGVKSKTGGVEIAQDYERVFDLKQPDLITIRNVSVEEGAGGFYLQVYCEDAADSVSSNCEFAPENLKYSVRITPSVNPNFIADSGGFRIFGDFQKGDYDLVIEAGLTSRKGGVLTETFTQTMNVPNRTPSATFVAKGRYLPRQRLTAVPIRHINVNKIKISVRQIPEQNIVFWMTGDSESADERNSDLIAEKEFAVKNTEDVEATSWLDLSGLVSANSRGVFEFTAETTQNTDSVRLILTKINLVVKRYGDAGKDVSVWALDSESLAPLKGVSIELMTASNRLLVKSATDADGLARFNNVADPLVEADRAPFVIIARSSDDLTAMRFIDLEMDLSEYQVQGAPYVGVQPYRAAIYMDRGVYRPGETARLVAIIWEQTNRAPKDALPVIGKVRDPRGNEIERLGGKTNSSGMVNFDLKFQDFAATGKYVFTLEVGGKEIERQLFLVEEFVPERMKAKLTPLKTEVGMNEPSQFKLEAKYLFGAIAKGERTGTSCSLEQGEFRSEQFVGYTFDVWRPQPFRPTPLGTVEGNLDDKGEATVTCSEVGKIIAFRGPGKITVISSVFEGGSGRTTTARASIPVHPDRFYVGLKSASKEARVKRKTDIDGVVVDWKGKPVGESVPVKIEIAQLESQWVWEYDNDSGRNTWRRYLREIPVLTDRAVAQNGRFKYSFTPAEYAYGYLVRVSAGSNAEADLYLKGEGYIWWEEGYGSMEEGETPKPAAPEALKIEAPVSAKLNQPVKVSFTLPYPGRLLFTVESNKLIESRWSDVPAGPFTAEFTIKEFTPNVYVSALLIKNPFYESKEAFIPGRSFGVASIKIEPEQYQLALKVTAPAEIQPLKELTVQLESEPQKGPLFATVAAVDEGILQLTNFKTPDPLGVLFKKRALGVITFETVGWTLLLPPLSQSASPGGDGAADEGPSMSGGRVQAIKPVALWSGLVEIGADGKATVKLKIPTFRGRLRVMAVAAGPANVASAETDVVVRDPIVIQPTFPRFLMAEDEFVLPVFVTNMTGKKDSIEVEIETSAEIVVKGDSKKTITLNNEQSGTVTFLCRAVAAYGAGKISVVSRAGANVSRDSAEIPLLPNGPVTQDVSVIKLTNGVNDLTAPLVGWSPQYEQTTVSVMGNRYAKELGHLKYLVHYPYGCIEQTTSTTRPLLYIGNLVSSIDPELVKDGNIEEKFMYGVRRLFSMQTSSGGFSYWPGEQDPTYWGTAYVTHLLLEGIDAGYPISKDRVNRAISFMENMLTHRPANVDPKYGYSMAQSEPYMQFVLAKAGKARPGRIKSLINKPDPKWGEATEENIFLLKAALYISGDRTYEKDLKKAPLDIAPKRTNGWTFWSALRTRGMMLEIMEDVFPNNPENESLANTIAERLKNTSSYYTTQELSWCVSALGKRAAGGAKSWSEPVLNLNGKIVKPLPKPKPDEKSDAWVVSGASGAKKFTVSLDNIQGGDLYALVRVEGIKPGVPYEFGDHFLQIRRQYRKLNGSPADMNNVRLGDVVLVELILTNFTGDVIQNMAVVDRFGAGFEIENPRLDREHAVDWIVPETLWDTGYVNMRDDHVEFFGNLAAQKQVKVIYALRAATGGRFTTPPVRAEAMYEPRQFSQQPGEPVRILDMWGALVD